MNKYECNICSWQGDQFNYMRTQPNVKCPECASLERHRAFIAYLRKKNFLGKQGGRCLEIGPPQAAYQKIMEANFDYVTADLDSPLATFKTDITKMQFQDGEFDVLICFHVLEHIKEDKKALAELYRCLKCDGIAFICVPLKSQGETEEYDEPDPNEYLHVREYGTDIIWRLVQAGFDVEVVETLNSFSQEEIEKWNLWTKAINGIIGLKLLFICRKGKDKR